MKKYLFAGIILLTIFAGAAFAEDIPIDVQKEIINNYMYLTGQMSSNQKAAFEDNPDYSEISHKCGMPIVHQFKMNYDKFDRNLIKSSGVSLFDRPVLPQSRVSPSGKFLIHYTTTGDSAVYSNVPGGASGYIDSVGRILDEVYNHTINTLGYPEPPSDSFYAEGGDEKFDIYLYDLPGAYYGLAYPDSIFENTSGDSVSTAFLELDNDYKSLSQYRNRPLDAVRVTAAHEFFHMVQFGIDVTESEIVSNAVNGPAWMEMSAVWMEEEIYDDINDYYNYLPFYFNQPWASIQQFDGAGDLHPYASVVYPLFLSEKYDSDIIKAIWLKCGEYGSGPHFLEVMDEVIDSVSGSSETYESAFAEFALWNYFTGSRASIAPDGYGYSERDSYDTEFSDDPADEIIRMEYNYPFSVPGNENYKYNPFHNGAFYLKMNNVFHLLPEYFNCTDSVPAFDTTYWVCNSGSFPNCTDSTEVTSVDPYEVLYVDTFVCIDSLDVMKFIVGLDPAFSNPWGFSIIYEDKLIKDSLTIDKMIFPAGSGLGIDILEPSKYNSVTFVFTPASSNRHFFTSNDYYIASFVLNTLNPIPLDSTYFSHETKPELFYPYPNPAVYSELAEKQITFKFQPWADSTFLIRSIDSVNADTSITDILLDGAFFAIDIFNINGELVRSLEKVTALDLLSPEGQDITSWDLKNESGQDVASGAYLAYLRLISSLDEGKVLKELKTKIAIIR